MDGFPVLGLLRPFRHLLEALGFRWALAYLRSTPLRILQEASHVHNLGLSRDDVGGVLLVAPSTLCGSPVVIQGRSGLPVLAFAQRLAC